MKTRCKTPFFVWFTGRSGSTFLCDLLDSHPQIHCRKEDFSEVRIRHEDSIQPTTKIVEFQESRFFRRMFTPDGTVDDPSAEAVIQYLEQIFSMGSEACGFKFKYPGQAAVYPEVMESLKQVEDLKVIELTRGNVLKQAISLRNVSRITQLESSQSSNARKQVDLDPLVLDIPLTLAHARFFLRSREDFRKQIAGFSRLLQVTYEGLLQDNQAAQRRILEFLEVDPEVALKSAFHKTTPDRLREAVQNYDQLATAVAGTELEPFLDQPTDD